jgi:NTE family protein
MVSISSICRPGAVAAALLLSACTTADPVNVPLQQGQNTEPHRFSAEAINHRPVILLAISGGGSRATALGLSVLQALREYDYARDGKRIRLIDDIRAVSSVSGGSVVAAYFVMAGPDRVDDLRKNFLARDNMATLEWEAAFPITWFRLAFTKYTRNEALADLFKQRLFGDTNFAAINSADRPILLLNATDMSSGEVFSFTPDMFDNICSDLGAMPLATAVAASANFPIALSPMTIRNFSKGCAAPPPVPGWMSYALTNPDLRLIDLEEYKRARYAASLRHLDGDAHPTNDPGKSPYRDVEHIHLMDGGVADNVGAHALIPLFAKEYGAGKLFNAINFGDLDQLVVITVNARSDQPNPLDQDPDTPGVVASVNSVTSVPIDATTAAVNALVREAGTTFVTLQAMAPKGANIRKLKIYDITIDFDQIPDSEAPLRNTVKTIPTSWTLTTAQLDAIDKAAGLMLQRNPCFRRLVTDLGIQKDGIDATGTSSCVTRPPDP